MNKNSILNKNITIPEFKELCSQCNLVQNKVLLDILNTNKETAIGKKYNFKDIKSVEDFRSAVPFMEWSNIEDYAKESEKGTPNLLFTGLPELFIITSGTTGQSKIIPESKNGLLAKNITTTLRMNALLEHLPKISDGKILPMANSAVIGKTESGIPYGTASGITLMNAPEKWRRMMSYPIEILKIDNPDALDYAIMRFAIENDVRMIICNNAGRLEQLAQIAEKYMTEIINDIATGEISAKIEIPNNLRNKLHQSMAPNPAKAEQLKNKITETGHFSPKEYWPNLQVISCWLAGSIGSYVKNIKYLFSDNIQFVDCGYGATEGKFNIPLELNNPAGPLAIHSGFYEFTSLDDKSNFLSAYQLEDGKSYEIYCTTYSGLYRYAMHDIIKVVGFTAATPNIHFVSKAADFANICGEKISPVMLSSIIDNTSRSLNIPIKHWCLVTDSRSRLYNFCIEVSEEKYSTTKDTSNAMATLIESELYGDGTLPYPVFRRQKLLNPAKVTLMKHGWFKAWFDSKKEKSRSSNQIKLPLVCEEIPLSEYIKT